MATRMIIGGIGSGKTHELVKYLAIVPHGVPTLIITPTRAIAEQLIQHRKGDKALMIAAATDMDHARQIIQDTSRGRHIEYVFIDGVPMGDQSMTAIAGLAEALGITEVVATIGLEGFYGIKSTTEITI